MRGGKRGSDQHACTPDPDWVGSRSRRRRKRRNGVYREMTRRPPLKTNIV